MPARQFRLVGHRPAQRIAKLCQLGVPCEVHICMILVGRLVITVGYIIFFFFFTPGQVMTLA